MRVFVDFEASSLAKDSYPIEVGWVFEDGRAEAHLIRPASHWTDWDPLAEAVHGIPRETLVRDGEPHVQVARRVLKALGGHCAYASAPSWDGKWLSVLLRGARLPRHALRLKDTDEAQIEIAREALRAALPGERLEAAVTAVLREVRARPRAQAHRALADARQELQTWLDVGAAAEAEAVRLRSPPAAP
jgi:hypothetical protein